jgi:signal transduction histidine kinase
MDALACGWDTAKFLIFSENVFSPLIYYSHLAPLIFSVLLGGAILFNNPRALVNRVLFAVMAFFSIWIYFDLILWASEKPDYIMFFWSAIVPIELLIYASAWYLVAIFANGQRDISLTQKLIVVASFVPMFLFTHTSYNLLGFDLTNCDREAIEGPLVQYLYVLELLFVGWIAIIASRGYRRLKNPNEKRQLLLLSSGVLCFLIFFSAGNILVSYFLDVDWSYEQYKLFGMPIFAALITYSAVRFKTFNVKIFLSQALILALAILVFSLLFLRTLENVRLVTIFTFILVSVLGYILVQNVRREIEQRELIEQQEKELEMANHQQESLLHFISHEIKGYLTDGQNAFAAIAEGDMGAPPPKIRELSQTALSKMRQGVRTVMDILDAANLKQGTVFYKKLPFDFRLATEAVVEHMRPKAAERGLTLDISVDTTKQYMISGDKEKISQHIIRNLIDNAIRYTPSGSVHVTLTRNDKIHFSVKDTGVGITAEDKPKLFTEGGHGKDSIKVNVDSTGYGLYVAKQVVEAHGGKVWAESAGAGKGSEFIVELPAA